LAEHYARQVGAAVALVCALRPAVARSADSPGDGDRALPCRPTVSCTADIATPGTLEAEVGGFYSKLGDGEKLWAYPFLVKQTFTKLLQLQLGSNGYTVLHANPNTPVARHVDNIVFGPKLHLLDQGAVAPSFALSAQASLPFDISGHRGGFLTAHASKDMGPLHADWNLGLDVWWGAGGGHAAAQPFTAIALSASPVPPFGVALEAYAVGDAQPYAARDGGLRGALTSSPRPWLTFDFGGDVGWFPSTHAFSLFLGMTVVPVVLWRE
jgi:hypothetical protein